MSYWTNAKRWGAAAVCAAALMAYGCVEDSVDDGDEAAVQAYNGPGSKWDFALSDGTFAITRRDGVGSPVTLAVGGTYERLASGFLVLTVGLVEGSDGPSQGDQAWAIEVPGYALLLKPMQTGSDQIIPMVSAGECPQADVDGNWVIVRKASTAAADDADRDFFGTFNYVAATGAASLPSRRALANGFQDGGAQALSDGTCDEGIMTVSDAVMYLTNNGGAIVHTSVNNLADASFIFALGQKAIADIANLDGDYAGMLFDQNQASGEQVSPVSVSCTAGTCTGSIVTDIVTGDTSAETVTITLDGTPDALGDGLVTGTISSGADSGNLACMADRDVLESGRKMVSCVGQSPGDNTQMFNVVFTSKVNG